MVSVQGSCALTSRVVSMLVCVKLSQVLVSCAALWPVHASQFPLALKFKARFFQQFSNAKTVLTCLSTQQSCYIAEWVGCRILCSCPRVHLELVFLKLPPQLQCWPPCPLLLCYPLLRYMACQVQRWSRCEAVVLDLELCMNLSSCPFAMDIPIHFLSETGNSKVYSACNSNMSSQSDLAFFTMDLIQIRHFFCNLDHMVLQNLLMQLPYWTGIKADEVNWKPFSDFSGFCICQMSIEVFRHDF